MAICYTMKTNNNLKKLALHRIQSGRAVEGIQASTQRPRVQGYYLPVMVSRHLCPEDVIVESAG